MSDDDHRPDPDALLAEIQEPRAEVARLRVFLGMCPGVGKTFAMLQAARGSEAVIGVVETHGRKETAALIEGLEVVPLKCSEHRGITVREMDLDALLARRPSIALVDELAHTNVPGSRHPKRHQDVAELLDAGISVWTTLNIQHVESRAEIVAELTGVTVRETVPDSLLDRADEVVLIDLPPEQLRARLSEGKVYQGERAAMAADQFFRMGNLTALRELALRYAAERAGKDFREFAAERKRTGPLRTNEKLLVAIGPSPSSESLIRRTRRAAGMLDATWFAVTVDTGDVLSEAARVTLTRHITLAQSLGAEVVQTSGQSVSDAVLAVARERHATQIIVGKPERRIDLWAWWRPSLVDRLIAGSGDIDVQVVRPRRGESTAPKIISTNTTTSSDRLAETGIALGIVSALTAACWFAVSWIGYWSVALIYLLAVVLSALRLGRVPILVMATVSALLWDFLFIPPRFTFYIKETHDGIMFAAYFIVALVIGHVTSKLRRQQQLERQREQRTATLLGFTQLTSGALDESDAMQRALVRLHELFDAPLALLRRNDNDHSLLREPVAGSSLAITDKDWSVATWVQSHRQAAGRFTETLPESRVTCLPLQTRSSIMGALVLEWPSGRTLRHEERSLLEALCAQLGLVLEKEHLASAMQRAEIAEQSNRLHKALLDSVSHELKTPIAALRASLDLQTKPADERGALLLGEMDSATCRLERVTTQLLDMTRIESGLLKPQADWCDIEEMLRAAVDHHVPAAQQSRIVIQVHDNFPPVHTDAGLLEACVTNLLLNALAYTPNEGRIEVTATKQGDQWSLAVRDHGAGIAEEDLPRLFDKFYRSSQSPAGGAGLGLSIVRGFARALGGKVTATNAPDGGAVFTMTFPCKDSPHA